MKRKTVFFTEEELTLAVAILQSLDPDKYASNDVKAVIYKAKAARP